MHGTPSETPELAAIRERENAIGIALDYQRDMAAAAPGSALRLQEIARLARVDQSVPEHVALMAALGATMAEDCGDCLQIYVNIALKAGVDRGILRGGVKAELHSAGRLLGSLPFAFF